MSEFASQIAVVTGASSGIGRAIARRLAQLGATLCLIGRNVESLRSLSEGDSEIESRLVCYAIDLTKDKDLRALKMSLQRDFEQVHILVHAAGVISFGRIETAPLKDFDREYRVNVRAPYALTQAVLPMLIRAQGQMVFINSSVSLQTARANLGAYAATKYALRALADSLRSEVDSEGIRVLSVYPGRTASPMQEMIHRLEDKTYEPASLVQPEDIAEVVVQTLSLPRTAEVTDISVRPRVKS